MHCFNNSEPIQFNPGPVVELENNFVQHPEIEVVEKATALLDSSIYCDIHLISNKVLAKHLEGFETDLGISSHLTKRLP